MFVNNRRGDTMIEVMFGVAIFGLVAASSIALMNNSLGSSEVALEATMARNEMDAQAEAIRYIHSSYASTNSQSYQAVWEKMTDNPISRQDLDEVISDDNTTDCEAYYSSIATKAFAINTAAIKNDSSTVITDLHSADTYPIVNSSSAHGIWVNVVESAQKDNGSPYYYDFFIRSCWYGIGSSTPSSLDTVVRLYNPDRRS